MPAQTNRPIQWVNALSTRPSLEGAIADVVERAQAALQQKTDEGADLGIVFISSAFSSEVSRLMPLLQEKLPSVTLIGCCGGGVVGMRSGAPREIEGDAALSLTLACLPDVKVQPFHLSAEQLPDLDSSPNTWIDLLAIDPAQQPQFVLFADPSFGRINDLLQGLDFAYAGSTKVGGLTTGGGMFCNGRLYREGAVGVALSGNIVLDTIVAQGCRPIGQPYLVTDGERNVMLSLTSSDSSDSAVYSGTAVVSQKRTPLEVLQDLIQTLNESDRALAQHSLYVGVAQSEFKQTLEQGDFLIRQLIGVDPRVGAIAIGDRIRPGQRIQFHLRDAKSAAGELETLLERHQSAYTKDDAPSSVGALVFSCNGRGENLYGEPDFDSSLFHQYFSTVPVGGFFCNGEIGPVGGNTFLHGFTSVFTIFRQQR
jgi:small ligand-binding sensory domain FIST